MTNLLSSDDKFLAIWRHGFKFDSSDDHDPELLGVFPAEHLFNVIDELQNDTHQTITWKLVEPSPLDTNIPYALVSVTDRNSYVIDEYDPFNALLNT